MMNRITLSSLILGVSGVLVLAGSTFASADGSPTNTATFRELDCSANLNGQYARVTQVIIKDFTYTAPPEISGNYNSVMDLIIPGMTGVEGTMNESNGNDPQDYRDSAPAEYSGTGGIGMYAVSQEGPNTLVFITRTSVGQRDLPKRNYDFSALLLDNNGNAVGSPLSTGQLQCQLRN